MEFRYPYLEASKDSRRFKRCNLESVQEKIQEALRLSVVQSSQEMELIKRRMNESEKLNVIANSDSEEFIDLDTNYSELFYL